MKRIILMGLVVVLALMCGCGEPYTSMPVTGEGIKITASDLYQAYLDDEVAADELYRDKLLEVTGEVAVSRNVLGTFYVILGQESLFEVWGIQCAMRDARDPGLYELEKGDEVTIRGYCDGYRVDVVLKECVLKE